MNLQRKLFQISNVSRYVVFVFVSIYIMLHVQAVGSVVGLENPTGASVYKLVEEKTVHPQVMFY